MGFVSHRCVALDDEGSTYHKARPAFLDSWLEQGLKVITVTGSDDAKKEAMHFEQEFKSISPDVLPRTAKEYLYFDLLLIGLGIDGHVGSIYPNLKDVYNTDICIPATSKNGKISLSLTSMLAAKKSVVACAGRSTKAPLGKAQALARSFNEEETPMSFPASALRDEALWLIDEPTALFVKPNANQ
jgi:6-phosphogluconolactonase